VDVANKVTADVKALGSPTHLMKTRAREGVGRGAKGLK
jgi:hypothetical protein